MFFNADKPFWREQALETKEVELLSRLFQAHEASVFRPNVSSEMVCAAAVGSGDYTKALAAALMTIGGLHGPITQTYSLLEDSSPDYLTVKILDAGQKVPGWGNSFAKAQIDPLWVGVDEWLRLNALPLWEKIDLVTRTLNNAGKLIYPNPGCYTAAAALALGIPSPVAPWLFVQGRLGGWTRLALKTL